MRIAARLGFFAGPALGLLLAPASPAQEQEPDVGLVSPPADRLVVAGGGVDMRTGRYVFSQTDLSIGGDAGGLALTRQTAALVGAHVQPFANFSHNFDFMLTETRVDLVRQRYDIGGPDYRISVHYGGRADTFDSPHSQSGFDPSFVQVSQRENVRLTYSGDRSGPIVYTYQAPDGTIVVFHPLANDCDTLARCAYPSQLTQPDGTQLDFEYDLASSGPNEMRLRSVVSSRGYAMLFEYGGGGGGAQNISKVCVLNLALAPKPTDNVCPANALATSRYTYTSPGGLASATDAGGGIWSYGYVLEGGNVVGMSFTRPGETTPWLTNSLAGVVVGYQVFADGQTYSYEYDNLESMTSGAISELAGGSYTHNDRTTVIRFGLFRLPRSKWAPPPADPMDPIPPENFGDARWQLTPGPVEVTDPLGRTTTYDYCDPDFVPTPNVDSPGDCLVDLLQYFTDPERIRTDLHYGDPFNHVTGTTRVAAPQAGQPPLDDMVTAASYDCTSPKTCAQPSVVTDANGHVTDRTFSAVHGGLLTATGPAVNGIRPQTRYEYDTRQARLSDGGPAGPPIWLLMRERSCRTTAASGPSCAGGAADEVITDYDYGPASGPNNLLLRGKTVTSIDSGVTTTLRTCYGYDSLGRRISETQPNGTANLSACP